MSQVDVMQTDVCVPSLEKQKGIVNSHGEREPRGTHTAPGPDPRRNVVAACSFQKTDLLKLPGLARSRLCLRRKQRSLLRQVCANRASYLQPSTI